LIPGKARGHRPRYSLALTSFATPS
jgi:hypothetical protein